MFKLDRAVYSSGKITDFKKESDNYINMNLSQVGEVFAYLQSVSYNYPINQPLKMDKTVFSVR